MREHPGATSAISFGKSAAASPFGPSKSKSPPPKPFTGAGNAKLFNEMDNLSPYMEPDAMIDQPWWKSITLGQVVSPQNSASCQRTCTQVESPCSLSLLA